MDLLEHFSIPYLGMKNGLHDYNFEVDKPFFEVFKNDQIFNGDLKVTLEIDKRPDMGEAFFHIKGYVEVECNRCLSPVNLEIDVDEKLHIKYGEEDLNEDEVIFINPETSRINFAQVIYEYICLALPMITAHEDIEDCDQKVVERLNDNDEDDDSGGNSIWGSLDGINFT